MHTFIGNLARDPDVAGDGDKTRLRMTVAVSDRYRDEEGQWQSTPPVYWTCWAWKDKATRIARAGLRKGMPIVITGKFRSSTWTTEFGEERSKTVFDVHSVGLDFALAKPEHLEALRTNAAAAASSQDETPKRQEQAIQPSLINEIGKDKTHAWDDSVSTSQED